jgi:outer membrane receptor protein involved in Fe transport
VFGPATNPFPFTIAVVEGNPSLESESAKTLTAGIVLTSPWGHPLLDRLTLSVDYFDIKVKDAIGTPTHNSIYRQCLDATFNSLVGDGAGSHTGAELAANNPFCALIQREYIGNGQGDWGAPRKFKAQYINQGGIKSRGIDVQFDWRTDLVDMGLSDLPGSFSVNVLASYLDSYAVAPFPGGAFVEYAGTTTNSSYDYRVFSTFGYANGPWSVGLRWQHLPSAAAPPGSGSGVHGVASHDQLDMFGRWAIDDRYEVRAGIDNVLNTQPEIVGATTTNAARGTTNTNYDQFGRRFFVALKATF